MQDRDAPTVERLSAERDAAIAEVERLRGYARHNGMCGIVGGYGYCTCGLTP